MNLKRHVIRELQIGNRLWQINLMKKKKFLSINGNSHSIVNHKKKKIRSLQND